MHYEEEELFNQGFADEDREWIGGLPEFVAEAFPLENFHAIFQEPKEDALSALTYFKQHRHSEREDTREFADAWVYATLAYLADNHGL